MFIIVADYTKNSFSKIFDATNKRTITKNIPLKVLFEMPRKDKIF